MKYLKIETPAVAKLSRLRDAIIPKDKLVLLKRLCSSKAINYSIKLYHGHQLHSAWGPAIGGGKFGVAYKTLFVQTGA